MKKFSLVFQAADLSLERKAKIRKDLELKMSNIRKKGEERVFIMKKKEAKNPWFVHSFL